MKKYKMKVALLILFLSTIHSYGQTQINLADTFQNNKMTAVNREISLHGENTGAIELDARDKDGLGILEDVEFDKGIIEIELLGENNPGKSFIGITFNIQNDSTYEAIYFRPFNFVAEEQIRKDHMVQYIFHPEFTWRKLREEKTGEFEDEISSPPNPDDWFKAIIKLTDQKVEVFINEISEPVLSVQRLTSTKSNKIGIWTGFGSSGRFRNLVLRKE